MKKYFIIVGFILINLFFLVISFSIYWLITERLIRQTRLNSEVELLFILPISFVGLCIFIIKKNFRKIGVGITGLFISIFMLAFFHFNEQFSNSGAYKSFKMRNLNINKNGLFLNIDFNHWYNATKVTPEKFINVDSVKVMVKPGLFGIETMTDEVIIEESTNCEIDSIEQYSGWEGHLEIGLKLKMQRCFSGAIHHFKTCIRVDSTIYTPYYYLGTIYMTQKRYDKALYYLTKAASVQFYYLSKPNLELLLTSETSVLNDSILKSIETKNFDKLGNYSNTVEVIDELKDYQNRVQFCLEQLKNQ